MLSDFPCPHPCLWFSEEFIEGGTCKCKQEPTSSRLWITSPSNLPGSWRSGIHSFRWGFLIGTTQNAASLHPYKLETVNGFKGNLACGQNPDSKIKVLKVKIFSLCFLTLTMPWCCHREGQLVRKINPRGLCLSSHAKVFTVSV